MESTYNHEHHENFPPLLLLHRPTPSDEVGGGGHSHLSRGRRSVTAHVIFHFKYLGDT